MKRILIFVLILAGCTSETIEPCKRIPMNLRVSPAQPIKFYLNDEETNNEKVICGVENPCWCLPVQCDDEVRAQVVDDETLDYYLQLLSKSGEVLHELPFQETKMDAEIFPRFGLWTQSAGIDADWSIDDTPSVSITGLNGSELLSSPAITGVPAGTYTVRWNTTTNDNNTSFTLRFKKEGVDVGILAAEPIFNGTNGGSAEVSISDTPDQITLIVFRVSPVGASNTTINFFSMDQLAYDRRYDVTFTPGDLSPALCDVLVSTKLVHKNIVRNSRFNFNTLWTNVGSGGNWTIAYNRAFLNLTGGSQSSKRFHQDLPQAYSGDVHVEMDVEQSATSDDVFFTVHLGAGAQADFQTTGAGTYNFSDDVAAVPSFDYIEFEMGSPDAGTKLMKVTRLFISIDGVVVVDRRSDCLDIRTLHDCTQKIMYWNEESFMDLIYDNTSPPLMFTLRLPADFWQDTDTLTQELHNLSNGEILRLRSDLEKERLFQLDYVPTTIHRLMAYVLMHDFIYIDGKFWVFKEGYERTNLKHLALAPAKITLTEKDIDRNIL